MQKIFHILQRKLRPHIHHKSPADDLGPRLKIMKGGTFCHPATLIARPAPTLSKISSDCASRPIHRQQHRGGQALCHPAAYLTLNMAAPVLNAQLEFRLGKGAAPTRSRSMQHVLSGADQALKPNVIRKQMPTLNVRLAPILCIC
jgi:hypothetical protein